MGERMAIVETKVDDLKKDISAVKEDIKDVKGDVKELKGLLIAQDEKYARKEELKDMQMRIWWIIGLLITIIFGLKFAGVL